MAATSYRCSLAIAEHLTVVLTMMVKMTKMVLMAKRTAPAAKVLRINVAEAKQQLSTLLGQVAFGGATVEITRRGKPMARLVPIVDSEVTHLADVKGWLDDDDPLLGEIDEIVAARDSHPPRVVSGPAIRTKRRTR